MHKNLPSILRVHPRLNREIIASGDLGPDKVATASHFLHAYRSTEFRQFVESSGAVVEVMSASGCLSATWQEMLGSWREDPAVWAHLIELEIEACREPGCLDLGTHILVVARKSG